MEEVDWCFGKLDCQSHRRNRYLIIVEYQFRTNKSMGRFRKIVYLQDGGWCKMEQVDWCFKKLDLISVEYKIHNQ